MVELQYDPCMCYFFQPTVSVGNVGQLTADLLINTLYMNRVGYFYDDCFLPMVGNDPFAHSFDTQKYCNLTTAVEGEIRQ